MDSAARYESLSLSPSAHIMTGILSKHHQLGWWLGAASGILFLYLATLLPVITESGAISLSIPWVPQLGLNLSLYLDGLGLLFALIISGVGAGIAIYAGYYFDSGADMARFSALFVGFMAAMLGVVVSGNILTLFIAWELTSLLSFMLISFHSEKSAARAGALQSLIITGGGGLALLVGLSLLAYAGGSTELSVLLSQTSLRETPLYAAFTVLIIVGAFTKSAQFPFHFWLPGAMSAPTPASAFLHSATMVKAGVYLLLRFSPILGDTALWETALIGVGLFTMAFAALWALRQTDLKGMLAYATISQLGALVALIGLPHGEGIKAAAIGILAHSLYKAALFMMAGAVDHATGTRELSRLGGLAAHLPGWAVVTVIGTLSMAGIPPLLGFLAKETLLEALLAQPIALAIVTGSAALTVTVAAVLAWDVFFAPASVHASGHGHIHALPMPMVIPPAVLVGASLVASLMLPVFIEPLLTPILGKEVQLSLFHGINTPLLLSMGAIAAGAGLFAARGAWRRIPLPALGSGARAYQGAVSLVERAGDLLLRSQNGTLRHYLIVILLAVIGLMTAAGGTHITAFIDSSGFNGAVDILRVAMLALAIAMMLASILFKKHLVAALLLGVAGYAVGGLFMLEPAPDVALVQFMVETVGAVLLIVMLARISRQERQDAMDALWSGGRLALWRDIAISAAVGIGVTLFAMAAVSARPTPDTIASYFIENTKQDVGITDIVGAIVTDYRGLDTMIEITVFSMAALGALTIIARPTRLTRVRKHAETSDDLIRDNHPHGPDQFIPTFSTPMTRIIAQVVLPASFMVALAHLFYGGDAPGDGFTAGVISGLGVALYYIVFGYHDARARLGWLQERRLIGLGLALVISNAALPLLFGLPFAAHMSYLDWLPLPAGLHLSSTFVYEAGILLTILGAVATVMESIGYPKEVEAL